MTQVGESAFVAAEIKDEAVTEAFMLRFQLVDESGNGLAKIPYKTVKTGNSAAPAHIADNKTTATGTTFIVSTTANETVDLHVVWSTLAVNKHWLKFK